MAGPLLGAGPTERAFTFDIAVDLGRQGTEIDNLDLAAAERFDADRLRVKKRGVDSVLAKYGKTG